ncbi:MAG: hypothetical protein ACFFED_07815 [Candidatus Thorarchaeota archaeon]
MSCETCGTVLKYGKRIPSGKKLCIDCWKSEKKSEDKKGNDDPK